MTIDTMKYWNAMRGISRDGDRVSVDAAGVCVGLAVREQFEADLADIRHHAHQVATLTADLEKLQADTEAECTRLKEENALLVTDNRQLVHLSEQKCAELRSDVTERDAIIDRLHAQIAILERNLGLSEAMIGSQAAKITDLTDQLALPAPAPAATNGNGDAREDLTFVYDNSPSSAPAAIDWAGLPDDYQDTVIRLANSEIKWTDISIPARRSIALCVISKMSTAGNLTMAEFDGNRPPYMPTASAISALFMQRWSTVVKNAVSTGVQSHA